MLESSNKNFINTILPLKKIKDFLQSGTDVQCTIDTDFILKEEVINEERFAWLTRDCEQFLTEDGTIFYEKEHPWLYFRLGPKAVLVQYKHRIPLRRYIILKPLGNTDNL